MQYVLLSQVAKAKARSRVITRVMGVGTIEEIENIVKKYSDKLCIHKFNEAKNTILSTPSIIPMTWFDGEYIFSLHEFDGTNRLPQLDIKNKDTKDTTEDLNKLLFEYNTKIEELKNKYLSTLDIKIGDWVRHIEDKNNNLLEMRVTHIDVDISKKLNKIQCVVYVERGLLSDCFNIEYLIKCDPPKE